MYCDRNTQSWRWLSCNRNWNPVSVMPRDDLGIPMQRGNRHQQRGKHGTSSAYVRCPPKRKREGEAEANVGRGSGWEFKDLRGAVDKACTEENAVEVQG